MRLDPDRPWYGVLVVGVIWGCALAAISLAFLLEP